MMAIEPEEEWSSSAANGIRMTGELKRKEQIQTPLFQNLIIGEFGLLTAKSDHSLI